MTVFNGERLEGIHRWHEWFGHCLSPDPDVRECSWEIEDGTVSWCVEFENGTEACVHVTEEALRLSEQDFMKVADQLKEEAWFEALIGADLNGIRIHSDGRLERFDSEEVWGARSGT